MAETSNPDAAATTLETLVLDLRLQSETRLERIDPQGRHSLSVQSDFIEIRATRTVVSRTARGERVLIAPDPERKS